MNDSYAWDDASRSGNAKTKGFKIEAHELDCKAVSKVICENDNGVTIRSIPAIHAHDRRSAEFSNGTHHIVLEQFALAAPTDRCHRFD